MSLGLTGEKGKLRPSRWFLTVGSPRIAVVLGPSYRSLPCEVFEVQHPELISENLGWRTLRYMFANLYSSSIALTDMCGGYVY